MTSDNSGSATSTGSNKEVDLTEQEATLRATLASSGTNLLVKIASHLETPADLDDAEAAAARFDVSPFRLWLLFQSVDENQDGSISKQELIHALTSASSTAQSVRGGTWGDTPNNELQDSVLSEEEDDDDSEDLERIALQDIQALNELYDRVVCSEQEHALRSQASFGDDGKEDDETAEQQNRIPARAAGISFPQFSRIMRYVWLQQLLNTELDNPSDPNNHYAFECVDYSSGYYRHKKITGNISEKRTKDFFMAPRHGRARMRWVDVPSGTFVPGAVKSFDPNNQIRQSESFRITILRLAIKYRFHPTSIEDAIDLDFQEPKVNS